MSGTIYTIDIGWTLAVTVVLVVFMVLCIVAASSRSDSK